MDEPVDHRGGDDVVAEDLAPPCSYREHQVRGLRVERDVANVVNDQQWDPAERGELVLKPALSFGV